MNTTQINNKTKYCIDCGCELIVGTNWTEAKQDSSHYICKLCITKRYKVWKVLNLEKYKEGNRISGKKYRDRNLATVKLRKQKCRNSNLSKYKTTEKNWKKNNPEKVKKHTKRYKSKRKRDLGWTPLYPNPFEDTVLVDWHHIDDEYVVAIPRDLHRLYNGYNNHRDILEFVVIQIYME